MMKAVEVAEAVEVETANIGSVLLLEVAETERTAQGVEVPMPITPAELFQLNRGLFDKVFEPVQNANISGASAKPG